ncbi:enoyl-CoA hydratase/isomerase family protein [Nocardia sp. NPDC059177]|uniref:enoyl-CoA hydratase/isomerase family protein n=1 Tax=Nocardia sp. NPDC059177 TaxID=3346759 RepID=UPI00367D651C
MSSDATDLALDALELDIGPDGTPRNPILVVPLDAWAAEPTERIEQLAAAAADSLRLTIGVSHGAVSPRLEPLLQALTLTVAGRAGDFPTIVEHPDPDTAVGHRTVAGRAENAPTFIERPDAVGHATPAGQAGGSPTIIEHPDPDTAVRHLTAAIERNPQASIALGRLLRQTAVPETTAGLAAEAAVYSMLLAGTEFQRWLTARGGPRTVRFPDRPLVRLDRDGALLSVTLDHPERRNALSSRLREELLDALRLAELDPDIDRVLLRGTGPVFCSGGDLDEFGTATDVVAAYQVRLERGPWRIIDRLSDRVTAHVHGACIGAGIEISAFAGRLIAAPDTYFRLPEIEMGLVPGAGGTVSVPRRIGRWRAAWMMLTGTRIDTTTALRWNLIDDIEELPVD